MPPPPTSIRRRHCGAKLRVAAQRPPSVIPSIAKTYSNGVAAPFQPPHTRRRLQPTVRQCAPSIVAITRRIMKRCPAYQAIPEASKATQSPTVNRSDSPRTTVTCWQLNLADP